MAAVNGLPPSNLVSKGSFFSLSILNRSQPMFSYSLAFFFSFLIAFFLSFSLCVFFLCKRIYKLKRPEQTPSDLSFVDQHLYRLINGANDTGQDYPTPLTHSLLLDVLPSNFYDWQTLFENGPCRPGSGDDDKREGSGGDALRVKKKKKRAKKKRLGLKSEQENVGGGEKDGEERKRDGSVFEPGRAKPDLVCCYPFTSTSSATQRKIKQHYDQLVKFNESNGLTLAQVGEFVNCLIEARNELQHKSEVIKRKFTITKVLLLKADRSSVDRYRQQIYKLEVEQKRLEEDAFVYNWLQQQLKLSPAYKQIVEISDSTELKAKSGELIKNKDAEVSDISFEELLAQEKKDAFWQKHGKSRTCSS